MTDIAKKQYVLSSTPMELPGLTGYHFEGHWLYVHPGLLEYGINKQTMMDRLGFALAVAKHPVKKLRAYLSRKGRR